MRLISKTVYEVQLRESNKHKVWRIIESTDKDFIGEMALCGLPQASNFPVGSKRTVMIQVPE